MVAEFQADILSMFDSFNSATCKLGLTIKISKAKAIILHQSSAFILLCFLLQCPWIWSKSQLAFQEFKMRKLFCQIFFHGTALLNAAKAVHFLCKISCRFFTRFFSFFSSLLDYFIFWWVTKLISNSALSFFSLTAPAMSRRETALFSDLPVSNKFTWVHFFELQLILILAIVVTAYFSHCRVLGKRRLKFNHFILLLPKTVTSVLYLPAGILPLGVAIQLIVPLLGQFYSLSLLTSYSSSVMSLTLPADSFSSSHLAHLLLHFWLPVSHLTRSELRMVCKRLSHQKWGIFHSILLFFVDAICILK